MNDMCYSYVCIYIYISGVYVLVFKSVFLSSVGVMDCYDDSCSLAMSGKTEPL